MDLSSRIAIAAIKLALGIIFYIVIISTARLFPTAAGMMLLFPMLNGLTLAAAPQKEESVQRAANTMLLLPMANCSLCGFYILTFIWISPSGALVSLLFGLSALWLSFAVSIVYYKVEIRGKRNQRIYILVCTILCIVMATLIGYEPKSKVLIATSVPWFEFLKQNAVKILLFIISFSIIIAISDFVATRSSSPLISRLLGIISGLPLVPLFGLYTIADPTGDMARQRVEIFGSLAVSIWLSPIIAIGFIFLFCEFLLKTGRYNDRQWEYRFAFLIPFWAGSFALMVGMAIMIDSFKPYADAKPRAVTPVAMF
jgi:hypothetical protein